MAERKRYRGSEREWIGDYPSDATLTIVEGPQVGNFIPLSEGELGRYPSFHPERRKIVVPHTGEALMMLSNGLHVIFRHLPKKKEHQYGLLVAFHGKKVNVQENEDGSRHTWIPIAKKVTFPELTQTKSFAGLTVQCEYTT